MEHAEVTHDSWAVQGLPYCIGFPTLSLCDQQHVEDLDQVEWPVPPRDSPLARSTPLTLFSSPDITMLVQPTNRDLARNAITRTFHCARWRNGITTRRFGTTGIFFGYLQ